MEQKINTSNPEAITYSTEELCYTILGGIRLEGLDRLRVTIKIEVVNRKFQHYLNNPDIAALAIRQNLDLYSITQVEKLARLIADRLEVGVTAVSKDLSDITNELESYRLLQIENKQQEQGKQIKPLTEQEKEAAITFLKKKNLLQATNELIGKSGMVGEELNRLIMWLIYTSRKTAKPLHIISMGSSGTGKSHLQEKVGELIPDEDKIEITALTENAFYYFDKAELGHKLILIEDLDGILSALYPLRELQSKQRISKTVTIKDKNGNTKTIHLKVYGPVCIAGCTTKESLYEDNANRCFLIYLDESREQDERIMDYQRKNSAGKINTADETQARQLLQNVQKILQPITVINPYAELLQIPKEVFKQRRSNAHYLAFIEVITFYNQYQRRWTDPESGEIVYNPDEPKAPPKEGLGRLFIETTIEDIEEANQLMKEILLRKSDELNGACRNYFEELKQWLEKNKQSSFTNTSIRNQLRIPISSVKRYHTALLSAGLIRRIENRNTNAYHFEIISKEEYTQLQNSIGTALDEALRKVKVLSEVEGQPNSPTSAHKQNEPRKTRKVKELEQQPTTA
jgi:predicted transcriptional regulator